DAACGRASILERPRSARKEALSLSSRIDRRSLWFAGGYRLVLRDESLSAQFALCGQQGGCRSSGTGLAPDLWAADFDQQLLEQFRTLSVSREAHPPDDRQRARRTCHADLRPWREHPRLALCRRSRDRI